MVENTGSVFVGQKHEVTLKLAIQQLHLVIADYIERCTSQNVEEGQETQQEEAYRNIIAEMEKALGTSQTTIQKLEADLSKEKFRCSQLENEWDAVALNSILVSR